MKKKLPALDGLRGQLPAIADRPKTLDKVENANSRLGHYSSFAKKFGKREILGNKSTDELSWIFKSSKIPKEVKVQI